MTQDQWSLAAVATLLLLCQIGNKKKSICNDKFSDALVATVSLDFIAHIVLLCTPRGNKMRGRKEEKLVFLKIYIL